MFSETVSNIDSVFVSLPSHIYNPQATLSLSQSTVTMCENLNLVLGNLMYDGGRPLGFSWSLVSSSQNAPLQSFLSSQSSGSVTLTPSVLIKLQAHQVQVVITNFLNYTATLSASFTPTGCVSVSATFSSDLTKLLLAFSIDDFTLKDSTLNTQIQSSSALCSFVFQSTTLSSLGASPACE